MITDFTYILPKGPIERGMGRRPGFIDEKGRFMNRSAEPSGMYIFLLFPHPKHKRKRCVNTKYFKLGYIILQLIIPFNNISGMYFVKKMGILIFFLLDEKQEGNLLT
jgi:hypothetical protein